MKTPENKEGEIKLKKAARTVIVDEDNRFAILEVDGGSYYKIPGGAIEEGESQEVAAQREALEEAGCEVDIIGELGENSFVETHPEYGTTKHWSVCYLARKKGDGGEVSFTEFEQSKKFKLLWVPYDEAIQLFKSASPTDVFGIEINKRDMGFLEDANSKLSEQG